MKKEEDEESSDEELLVKTGVSTVSLNENELPSLPQKSASKRLRISVRVLFCVDWLGRAFGEEHPLR